MGAIGSLLTGSSASSSVDSSALAAQQAQFEANFKLETEQAMIDNTNATQTAIAQSHSQTAASSQAGEREVGDAQAKIIA